MNYSIILLYFTFEFKPKNSSNVYCMKRILPVLIFVGLIIPVFSQVGVASHKSSSSIAMRVEEGPNIKIFPNPATEYIELSENDKVSTIVVYNLAGREMKRFDAYNGEKYYVGDLARGLYLVQLLDTKNQTVVTQRVSKR